MSECPVDQPTDEAIRPSPPAAGHRLYAIPEPPPEGQRADFMKLVDRVRRDARTAAKYGLLSRHDEPDDPNHGVGLFEAVVFQDTSQLNDAGWLDRVEAIARTEARLAALKAEAIVGFEAALRGVSADIGHRYPEPGDRDATPVERRWVAGDLRSVADEIALALQMHKGAATARIRAACELVHNFPATLRALEEGELTERAAFTIVRELSVLEDVDDIRAAEAAVLDWARKHPLTGIKRTAQREAARLSPAARSKAHARAMEERSVRIFPTSDGTAELVHTQDAIDAAAVMNSLTRAAAYRRRRGDNRSLDQLRADIALARLLPRTNTTRGAADVTVNTPGDNPAGNAEPDSHVSERPAATTSDSHSAGGTARSGPACDGELDGEPEVELLEDCPLPAGYDDAQDFDGDALALDDARSENLDDGAADVLDDAVIGAETTVVIHATGAELRALINGEEGTGGDAEHHGPIPQSSLRKHLIRALSRTLLHGSAATNWYRTDRPTAPDTSTLATARRSAAAIDRGRARIDIRITDDPPVGSPDTYTPTASVDRYVRLRDRTCQFPGCNRPAEFADLDHRTAFAAGGRTTTDNLHCLCRHHHRLKHHGGWTITLNSDGTTTWTSPTGRRYRTPPPEPDPPTTT